VTEVTDEMWGDVYISSSFWDAKWKPSVEVNQSFAVLLAVGFRAYDRKGDQQFSLRKKESNAKS